MTWFDYDFLNMTLKAQAIEEKLGKPYIGQKLWICKRNMIIPYIERAEKKLD